MRSNLASLTVACIVATLYSCFAVADDNQAYVIFDDSTRWTLNGDARKVDLNHTGTFRSGKTAIALHESNLELVAPEPISASGYDRIEFWAHGGKWGTGAKRYDVFIDGQTATYGRMQRYLWIVSGRWEKYSVPLRFLGNPTTISRINIRPDGWGGDIFIDDIRLARGPHETHFALPEFPEMLIDGGFENGANGQYTMGCKVETVTSPVHSGKYALRVYDRPLTKPGGPKTGWTGPDFEISPYYFQMGSGVYEIEAWFYVPNGKARVNVGLEVLYADPLDDKHGREWTEGKSFAEASAAWTQVKFRVKVKSGQWMPVFKVLPVADGDTPEYFVDSVSVKKVPDAAAPDAALKPERPAIVHVPTQGDILDDVSRRFKITVLGNKGSQAGEFLYPNSVAIDKDGDLLVADTDNHRIQRMDPSGKWTIIGKQGAGHGEFQYPRGLAIGENGTIFVNDAGNRRIVRYQEGHWSLFCDCDTLEYGNWTNKARAKPFLVEAIGHSPTGLMAVDLWYCRLWQLKPPDTWEVLSASESNQRYGLVTYGMSAGRSDLPMGACADMRGNIYLADTGNHRIQKRDAQGRWTVLAGVSSESSKCYVPEHLGAGTKPGQFNLPRSIAVDTCGNVYVADTGNQRIQVHELASGKWLAVGKKGAEPGQFNHPCAVAVDIKGNIYVADSRNHRVQVLTPRGELGDVKP